MDEFQWLTFDLFEGRVGEAFEVRPTGAEPLAMELISATEGAEAGGPSSDGRERRQFSLLFRGPNAPALPQSTYRLAHAELGDLDLFLVPIGPDPLGMRYEAAFA